MATKYGGPSVYNPLPQGFSETLYAYVSQGNNNGSAFAGFTGFVQPNAPGNVGSYTVAFANIAGGLTMLICRFIPLLAALAVAGSLAPKRPAPVGLGTMRTDSPTFVVLLIGDDPPRRPAHLRAGAPPRPRRPIPHHPALLMPSGKDILRPAIAILVFSLLLGLVYPLVMTGIAQVLFPKSADGSRVEMDGKVVGSELIGQDFRRPVIGKDGKPVLDEEGEPELEPDPAYFQSRPSVTGYSANVSYFNNLGPNNKELSEFMEEELQAYLKLEGRYDPGLTAADVPVDAVTHLSLRGGSPDLGIQR